MEKVTLGDQNISYQVIRSKRKTVGLEIQPHKGLIIRAPKNLTKKQIQQVIIKKQKWILEKLARVQEIKPGPKPLKFVTGEQVLLFGVPFTLKINHDLLEHNIKLDLDEKAIRIQTEPCFDREEVLERLIQWYREQAREIIDTRVDHFKKIMDVEPNMIRIKNQKKRWGSCSSLGNLNFNWRIVMAPFAVIDYLVVHELAHLKFPNHSAGYWGFVEQILPEYQKQKEWLRIHGSQLNLL